MRALGRSQTADSLNPALVFYGLVEGWLTDLASLEFQVFDVSSDAKRAAPVQVYPTTPGNRATVDVSGVDRLGKGRYVATYTPASNEPIGEHEVRWFWRVGTEPTRISRTLFEVVSFFAEDRRRYGSISRMRAEGFSADLYPDARMQRALEVASDYVEGYTRRTFEARYATPLLDGDGNRIVMLDEALIALESVEVAWNGPDASPTILTSTEVCATTRHLTQNLLRPDDRNNPRVELASRAGIWSGSTLFKSRSRYDGEPDRFPNTPQSIRVRGLFGYTDALAAVPWGVTPSMIDHVTCLLARREVAVLADQDGRETDRFRGRIQGETTREQSYTLGPGLPFAVLTGDDEIDTILQRYQAPPSMVGI